MAIAQTQERIIERFIERHGDTYDYSLVDFKRTDVKVTLRCHTHGPFTKTPSQILLGTDLCPSCNIEAANKKNTASFLTTAKEVHGDRYDYSLVEYTNSHTKIKIVCPDHGIFEQKAYSHTQGKGCRLCADKRGGEAIRGRKKKINPDSLKAVFLEKFNSKNLPYKIKDIDLYVNSITPFPLICEEGHEFYILPVNVLRNFGCSSCGAGTSKAEKEIKSWLTDFRVLGNIKGVMGNKKELDIYLPDDNLAIEVNGVNWHHEGCGKDVTYHLNKTLRCKDAGITLLHFTDLEIVNKPDIVKSMIMSRLGRSTRLFARKLTIKEVGSKEARLFLDQNHLQGAGIVGSHCFGLYQDDELMSLMTFCSSRFNKDYDYELLRFCNKLGHSVAGGASRLLTYAKSTGINNIVSYANKRWSEGNLYRRLGFVHLHTSRPNYMYTNGNKVISRNEAQKHKLKDLLKDKFDEQLSEHENMLRNGWFRMYDCGNEVFGMK